MTSYGPDERALFESHSSPLFEEIVKRGSLSTDDPRIQAAGSLEAAFTQLVDLGLVHLDRDQGAWVPDDPSGAQGRVVTPLSNEGSKLLEESAGWARALGSLGQIWRKAPTEIGRGPVTYLHAEAIEPYLAVLVSEAEEEMLTAQPQAGRDQRKLAMAVLRDTTALERGVRIRTLYQHSARRNSATLKYVGAVTERGAEVRTLDEFFNRMIVIDRRVAVIPNQDDLSVAVAVREPSIVAYLVDVFARSWERARPFTSGETGDRTRIADEQRSMTMRMLIEGHSDPVSAKRLGVSPRTYAGYVADLKTEFAAETRFQLGYLLGQLASGGNPDDVEDVTPAP